MKIKCQVCGIEGYLQHIGKNYFRVRHYVGFKNGKPVFTYHRQEPAYVRSILGQVNDGNLDPKKLDHNLYAAASSKGSEAETRWAGSSAWYECLTCTQEAGGSNPPQSTRPWLLLNPIPLHRGPAHVCVFGKLASINRSPAWGGRPSYPLVARAPCVITSCRHSGRRSSPGRKCRHRARGTYSLNVLDVISS